MFELVPDELATDEAVSDKLAGASEVNKALNHQALKIHTKSQS